MFHLRTLLLPNKKSYEADSVKNNCRGSEYCMMTTDDSRHIFRNKL